MVLLHNIQNRYIALLSIASFGGIYKVIGYKVKNIVPDYIFGTEFSKSRVVELKVDDCNVAFFLINNL